MRDRRFYSHELAFSHSQAGLAVAKATSRLWVSSIRNSMMQAGYDATAFVAAAVEQAVQAEIKAVVRER